jgi:hypothetical protein
MNLTMDAALQGVRAIRATRRQENDRRSSFVRALVNAAFPFIYTRSSCYFNTGIRPAEAALHVASVQLFQWLRNYMEHFPR